MPSIDDYKGQLPAWCPGCGNFPILKTLKEALSELNLRPEGVLLVSGIGQGAKLTHYLRSNSFNGLHGRALPVATAARLANYELPVIVIEGDGGVYGEGGNHLMHAIRRNIGITALVHDNQVYGLTKGQASPTTAEGTVTKNAPFGVFSEQLNPLALAVALDASFVARGFSGDTEQLKALMKQAIGHEGFALLDVLQPCVSFNKVNTYAWYKSRVYHIEPEYDPTDRVKAFERSLEWGERIPTGVIFRNQRPPMEKRIPVIDKAPLVKQPFDLKSTVEGLLEGLT